MAANPWPWPGDSREDKAKRIAQSYRDLIRSITQNRCEDPPGDLHRLDEHWRDLGITWHTPAPIPADPDDWLCAADIAQYISRTTKDIYNWAHRGHIQQRCGADGTPEYLLQSVLDDARRKTQRRHTTRQQ